MRTHRLTAAILALSLLTGCTAAEVAPPQEPPAPAEYSVAGIRPGDDFYGYCNARTLGKPHTSAFDEVQNLVDSQVEAIILSLAQSDEEFAPGSDEQLVHDLYHLACDTFTGSLDTDSYDEALIREVLDAVAEVRSIDALCSLWGEMVCTYGCAPAFSPCVTADLQSGTHNVLMIRQFRCIGNAQAVYADERDAAELRDQVFNCLTAAETAPDVAEKRADAVYSMLLEIAAATQSGIGGEGDDPAAHWTHLTERQLSEQMQQLSAAALFEALGCGILPQPPDGVVLEDAAQFSRIVQLLDDAHLQAWKDYTTCAFLQLYADTLPAAFGTIRQQSAAQTAQDYAVLTVRQVLGYELGELYAQRYCSEAKRRAVTQLCIQIQDEYEALIRNASWLSAQGRSRLLEKLWNMPCFVGADEPHEVCAEDAGLIGASLLETHIHNNRIIAQSNLLALYDPVVYSGRTLLDPLTVNACYDPVGNCFTVTAALLNAPLYDENDDDAANLGGIGMVIAHEIAHAFDANGMLYDANGSYRPTWMPESDRAAFAARTRQAADYYTAFLPQVSGDGQREEMVSENIADLSAMQCVLSAAGTPDRQQFVFERYAGIWYEPHADRSTDQTDDVHAPAQVRVNAVVACFDAFYEIYDVREDAALYVPPEERIRIW